jgi:DNA replication and repair protein RecF
LNLKSISIRSFRNIARIDYQPDPGLNLLVGDNAQGKTNLLEAIYVIATGSSFRSGAFTNLIKENSDTFSIKAWYEVNHRNIESSLQYRQKQNKIYKINNKKTTFANSDRLRVVIFNPDDLYLVKGNPALRRNFIDFILKQLSGEYFNNLDQYVSILKKRNFLLRKEQANTRSFAIVNDIFIEKAAQVTLSRINFISLLENTVNPIYQQINTTNARLKIRYAVSFPVDSDKIKLDILAHALGKQIKDNNNKEISRRTTLFGPHVEDINFYQEGKLARFFSSQGQQRNIVVSLKLAEIHIYQKIKGFYPVFLLDEVLAELDKPKQERLMHYLKTAAWQSFLTSVSPDHLDIAGVRVVEIKNGSLQ